ncbi:hypothetical protein BD833_106121 [Blastococcus xanthinilyticus]|uniref:Uncharacterized protein n=1 Tax=Blastococcus xanthinilyticus TaxID=1564164 RepID=A0A5S5CYA1_9ACTN|nr:hypothetical protein BD833_106121 [Blastococcus xanthinilyticus]
MTCWSGWPGGRSAGSSWWPSAPRPRPTRSPGGRAAFRAPRRSPPSCSPSAGPAGAFRGCARWGWPRSWESWSSPGRCAKSWTGGRPPVPSSSPATWARATAWCCRWGTRRGSSSTPARTPPPSTGAWTGWGSTTFRSCCSRTWTPTTSGASPVRWAGAPWGWWPPAPWRRPTTARRWSTPWCAAPGACARCWSRGTGARCSACSWRCSPRIPGARPRRPIPTGCRWWPGHRSAGCGCSSPATSAPTRRPPCCARAPTWVPTCSRSRTTAAATPTRTSWPPRGRRSP